MGGGSYVKIVVDSNFLIAPFLFGRDFFSELGVVVGRSYEVVVLDKVLEELEKLAEKGSEGGKLAKAALNFVRQKAFKVCPSGVEGVGVDDAILEYARRERCVVATNDNVLRKRLRKAGIPVIYLRQRSHLCIDGEIL
ncbi:MAG: hypothetical protein QXP17_00045 [Candidatus Jordarchaeales archaeon]